MLDQRRSLSGPWGIEWEEIFGVYILRVSICGVMSLPGRNKPISRTESLSQGSKLERRAAVPDMGLLLINPGATSQRQACVILSLQLYF